MADNICNVPLKDGDGSQPFRQVRMHLCSSMLNHRPPPPKPTHQHHTTTNDQTGLRTPHPPRAPPLQAGAAPHLDGLRCARGRPVGRAGADPRGFSLGHSAVCIYVEGRGKEGHWMLWLVCVLGV